MGEVAFLPVFPDAAPFLLVIGERVVAVDVPLHSVLEVMDAHHTSPFDSDMRLSI